MAEKMITLGKKNTLASRRAALAYITKEDVVKKLFDQIAPDYADRNGGYTRIYQLGPRRGDGAEMAVIKLVADEKSADEPAAKTSRKASRKAAKAAKDEAADAPVKTEEAPAEA